VSAPVRTVGLLGGGVIGGGWAARFLLNGIDVRLYDPDPETPRKVEAMLANARRAYGKLTLAPLPAEGSLSYASTPEEAAAEADFVQESAPERVELKRDLLAAASRAARPDTVFASSTSGLRPTLLQSAMDRPERMTVGHPFNPVYLLPLVELCPGEATARETLDRAAEIYGAVGMKPLRLEREIDGFIADRLLEALWREALWLVNDGVATVEEVDDAIRYGPGLRWSMMGTFLLYRIAGGEDGVRHFMAQFGPALQWPWTKLTDVPELTDELLETLERQSDEQAAGRTTGELERLRDDCLVSVLQALRVHDVGAGASLREYEEALLARADGSGRRTGPLLLHETRVAPDWIDYNGHAHESSYLRVTGDATDALLRSIGVDAAYVAAGGSYYTVETHLRHVKEANAEERLSVTTQVLGADDKRLHIFHRVARARDDELLATVEQMLLHVDTAAGRAAPAPERVLSRVRRLAEEHARLPAPDEAGRRIELKR
jgi:carnitine 3-dehydrogenase / betainyl-CoA thioesterase